MNELKIISYNKLKEKLELERHLAIEKLKEHPFHNNYYLGYLDLSELLLKYIEELND